SVSRVQIPISPPHSRGANSLKSKSLRLFRISEIGLIRTGDTIMFLLRDRNATYYARFYFPQSFKLAGYPKELRFSLKTTKRSEAIDRLLSVLRIIREHTKELPQNQTPQVFLRELRVALVNLRNNNFLLAETATVQTISVPCKNEAKNVTRQDKREDLLALFLESKRVEKVLPRTIQQLGSRIGTFLNFCNNREFPANASTKEVLSFRDHLLKSSMSEKSAIEYIAAAKQFYKWLVIRGDIDKNPFDNILIKRKKRRVSDERSRWNTNQLSKLFSHFNFDRLSNHKDKSTIYSQKEHEDFWVPLVLLHSGARVSEICQLNINDIERVNDIWCLSINENGKDKRLKSASAIRKIPVHPNLIKLGFLDYVDMRKNQCASQLFTFKPYGRDKDWSKAFIVRFSKVLDELGFKRGNRPTLHGLRHTFIDELQQIGAQEHLVADIVGHAKSGITFGRYAKQIGIEVLYETVKRLNFHV
ncbi:TPA: tyrosine-type recombinase/integrase, partial [Vibrio parahaemolyticus]